MASSVGLFTVHDARIATLKVVLHYGMDQCLCTEISPPTFYSLSVKITQNKLMTSFIEVHYFASFLRNFALNKM